MTEAIDRQFAAQEAEEIRQLIRRAAQDIAAVGQKLAAVKARLKHGEWGEWLRAEFDWNERTAQRFMSVGERFKNDNLSDLDIAPSALYLLAAASTPDDVCKSLVERAKAGERITHSLAQQAIEDAKDSLCDDLYGDVVMKTYEFSQEARAFFKAGAANITFPELLEFIRRCEVLEHQWREYRVWLDSATTHIRLDDTSALAQTEKQMNECLLSMQRNTTTILEQLRGIACAMPGN